jgi:hypothetical protein
VRLAGGPTEQADMAGLNQAAHLIDGQRVLVPRVRALDAPRPFATRTPGEPRPTPAGEPRPTSARAPPRAARRPAAEWPPRQLPEALGGLVAEAAVSSSVGEPGVVGDAAPPPGQGTERPAGARAAAASPQAARPTLVGSAARQRSAASQQPARIEAAATDTAPGRAREPRATRTPGPSGATRPSQTGAPVALLPFTSGVRATPRPQPEPDRTASMRPTAGGPRPPPPSARPTPRASALSPLATPPRATTPGPTARPHPQVT